jgi:hypothetical protein
MNWDCHSPTLLSTLNRVLTIGSIVYRQGGNTASGEWLHILLAAR